MEIIIIAAFNFDKVIGKNGKIPWHIKEELQFFKKTTYGYPVIMGRKTYESLKNPLPGRLNIVLTRNNNYKSSSDNVLIFNDISEALNYCSGILKSEKVFIIGGAEIYSQALMFADKMILSIVNIKIDGGDAFFPDFDLYEWEEISQEKFDLFIVKYYRRKLCLQK